MIEYIPDIIKKIKVDNFILPNSSREILDMVTYTTELLRFILPLASDYYLRHTPEKSNTV